MSLFNHQLVQFLDRYDLSRRSFLQIVSAGVTVAGTLNFRQLMSVQAAELRKQGRSHDPLVDAGGTQPVRNVRPQAGDRARRPDPAIATAASGIQIANGWDNRPR